MTVVIKDSVEMMPALPLRSGHHAERGADEGERHGQPDGAELDGLRLPRRTASP
ncbi:MULTISPECIES: hypothetical protein [unclassified Mesorhizobium]|uniref:hypothetical protein n=1 Tax=unclassified Mesorhizobium TaxID=325217 RepID=UPI0015E3CB52|nr:MULTISPECIES: hypothetical protein [unclassified Mesorhizobium]